MRVGIGLPVTIPRAPGRLVVEWAKRADQGPFSSLGALDRVLYDNYEPMTALAAAAAVTSRIRLASTIVIAPLRNTVLLAKQAASVNALSGGRFVLGLGLGARSDDYELTGASYRTRGRDLTRQLAGMQACWEDARVGPLAATPPALLVGGSGGRGMARMARFADGFVHNGGPPRAFARAATEARAAWLDCERPGQPELWGMAYYALGGERAAQEGMAYLRDYYAFTGPFADKIASGLLTTPSSLRELVRGYAEAGCDELVLFPGVVDLGEIDRLADALGGSIGAAAS